ncbi:hypothetical protein E6H35_08295 [Candidatus Bathyarchaeota archaeon]|nr:MAG: hypothetical protein E6H35_08295 [Candidatus Bathyarchaeota archaeon]
MGPSITGRRPLSPTSLPASSSLRPSRSSSETLSLIALASFSFLSTTLPHHYQESKAQRKKQLGRKVFVQYQLDQPYTLA